MNGPAAPDRRKPFHGQPQRYGIAFLGPLDAFSTNCLGFPFEKGLD
jgi:hypothetical protein